MGILHCCVNGCFSNNSSTTISLFRFPKDPKRCVIWAKNCGRDDIGKFSADHAHANYGVCSLHFEDEMFLNLEKTRLQEHAVPTVFKFNTVSNRPQANIQFTDFSSENSKNSIYFDKIPSTPLFSEEVNEIKNNAVYTVLTDRRPSKKKCCVPGCLNKFSQSHRFPIREPELFQKWLKAVNYAPLFEMQPQRIYKSHLVCHDHFAEDATVIGTKRGLKATAVPTLFVPGNTEEKASDDPVFHISDEDLKYEDQQQEEEYYQQYYCRTCLNITDEVTSTRLAEYCFSDKTVKDVISILVPKMASTVNDTEVVCNDCFMVLESTMGFIEKCLEVEETLAENEENEDFDEDDEESYLMKEYTENEYDDNSEAEGDIIYLINTEHDYYNKDDDKSNVDLAASNENMSLLDYVINETKGNDSIEIECDLESSDVTPESVPDDAKVKVERIHSEKFTSRMEDEIGALQKIEKAKVREKGALSCVTCLETFETKDDYKCHLEIHPPYICDYCGKAFVKKESLRAHSISHNDPNSYICEVCGKGSKDYNALKCHLKVHKNDETFKCSECPKVFKNKHRLQIHVKFVHQKIYRDQCPQCGILFRSQGSLKNHIRLVHLKVRPYQCNVCRKQFGRIDYLQQHKAANSCSENDCLRQRKKTNQVDNLQFRSNREKRTKVILNENDELLPCKFCGKVIKDRVKLERHLHIHINRHKCRFCPQTFVAKSRRNQHELIHQNMEVFFRCNVCYRKFKTQEELDGHAATQIHRRQPRYSCDICGEKFHRRFSLSQHNLSQHVGIPENKIDTIVYDSVLENSERLRTD